MKEITRKIPENFKTEDISHFELDLSTSIDSPSILKVKNALIIQRYVYRNFLILSDYCHTPSVRLKGRFISAIKPLFFWKRKEKIDKAIWSLDTWSKGYFHWLTDFLPRCITAEEYWGEYPVLVPSYFFNLEYVRSSLDIFDFQTKPYPIFDSFYVSELLIPTRLRSCNFEPNQILKVRNYFRKVDKFEFSKKRNIYISRSKSERRKIKNETKVQNLLKIYGVETHYFEDYTFQRQRKLMSETVLIISNHGAGLTNMIFMPDNSKILELKSDCPTINNCFFNLARALDHEYYYTLNKGDSNNVQASNIEVDLIKLEEFLITHTS